MANKANEVRGEIDIELEGETFVLRPTRDAIRRFRKATGKSLLQLAQAAGDGSIDDDEIAAVVAECIRAGGKATGNSAAENVNDERVGDLLMEYGYLQAGKRVELLLFLAATGGYTAQGEVRAIGKNMTAIPTA